MSDYTTERHLCPYCDSPLEHAGDLLCEWCREERGPEFEERDDDRDEPDAFA